MGNCNLIKRGVGRPAQPLWASTLHTLLYAFSTIYYHFSGHIQDCTIFERISVVSIAPVNYFKHKTSIILEKDWKNKNHKVTSRLCQRPSCTVSRFGRISIVTPALAFHWFEDVLRLQPVRAVMTWDFLRDKQLQWATKKQPAVNFTNLFRLVIFDTIRQFINCKFLHFFLWPIIDPYFLWLVHDKHSRKRENCNRNSQLLVRQHSWKVHLVATPPQRYVD